jgi:LmbE family N-acetylglucosaminyl deacetylase/glycosyltransferase involved in cell wall biosynthesis
LDEGSLIPYRASELTAERLLVLGAHPDDEVLGAGGAVALNAGAQIVRVWIATDGTRQEGVAAGEEDLYATVRRDEARRAAEALGVAPPLFGGLPDRQLAEKSAELDVRLASLIEQVRPDLILCPSPVEIHPDHRALAEAVFTRVAASRPGDSDHDLYRFLRVAFYEISHPLLPNTLVDISAAADRKREALAAYASQQRIRDYAGALAGLSAYRGLTLAGAGPIEAFRVVSYGEISTLSLETFRRSIGPTLTADGARGPVPVSVVVRTRNRPALLQEALESLRAQTARPRQVVVVNDGGARLPDLDRFRDAWELTVENLPSRAGRSSAANRGVALATQELVAFLDDDDLYAPDHLERLFRAYRQGPEPVVYSDAVTAVYEESDAGWRERHRGLEYSLDYDADYLLLANYIPLHTILLPKALYLAAGGFEEGMEYSEDWDFLIRLSFQTGFRHVRAVTCEYRVFEERHGGSSHVAAGASAFQAAREKIYARYASRRTDAGVARAFDRLRSQLAFWYERDGESQGELRYQRESHLRLVAQVRLAEEAQNALSERRRRVAELETERARLLAENELAHGRIADLYAANERYDRDVSKARAELDRLGGILRQIYASRTWKLHLLLDRLRGRS